MRIFEYVSEEFSIYLICAICFLFQKFNCLLPDFWSLKKYYFGYRLSFNYKNFYPTKTSKLYQVFIPFWIQQSIHTRTKSWMRIELYQIQKLHSFMRFLLFIRIYASFGLKNFLKGGSKRIFLHFRKTELNLILFSIDRSRVKKNYTLKSLRIFSVFFTRKKRR